jgi:hypothetical protein
MEFMQTKIPLLPADWTLARGGKYLARLVVFILVPGLHQIACGRKVLGWMLFLLVLATLFCALSSPIDSLYPDYSGIWTSVVLVRAGYVFSWILLLIDLRSLEHRSLTRKSVFPLACVILLWFLPLHDHREYNLFVVEDDRFCPMYCKHDIVQFQRRILRPGKLSQLDFVIAAPFSGSDGAWLGRLLAYKPEDICEAEGGTLLGLPAENFYCYQTFAGDYLSLHALVIGGPKMDYSGPAGEPLSLVLRLDIRGYKLKKIGNTHRYLVYDEGLTELVGNSLLTIYKWTGIDFLGMSGYED